MGVRARAAALAVAGAAVVAVTGGTSGATATGASACRPQITTLATGQGGPDDLAWDGPVGSRLLVSDVHANTLGVVSGGRVHTLMSGIGEPEGIIVRSPTRLELAAQTTNQILAVDLARHTRRVIASLPNVPGQSGVDSIEAAPGGDTYAPDSANGKLYLLHAGRLRVIASGMIRPVDARQWQGKIAVADEYASYVDVISGARRTHLAKILLPDDLVISGGHLLATSLAGALWEVAPHRRLLTKALHDPQGLVPDGPGAVLVADQQRNRIVRISGLARCL